MWSVCHKNHHDAPCCFVQSMFCLSSNSIILCLFQDSYKCLLGILIQWLSDIPIYQMHFGFKFRFDEKKLSLHFVQNRFFSSVSNLPFKSRTTANDPSLVSRPELLRKFFSVTRRDKNPALVSSVALECVLRIERLSTTGVQRRMASKWTQTAD